MSSQLWNDLARSINMYRKCIPKESYGLDPKSYGISLQGKHRKKKRGVKK